ncbi:hypothetical protein [Paraflavitalea pollutisoli]|uniref:hypothetical protein n=1 Tax=Paraflavitalea pollutisoli TaxID=3034143 RepID=UPI0023EBA546|nr:hypothetical protein [Paraflavitalea sp. H1-2-19X]
MTARIELLFNKFMEGSCSQQEFSEFMNLLQTSKQEVKLHDLLYEVYQQAAHQHRSITYVDERGELHTAVEHTPASRTAKQAPKPQLPFRRSYLLIVVAALLMAAAFFLW